MTPPTDPARAALDDLTLAARQLRHAPQNLPDELLREMRNVAVKLEAHATNLRAVLDERNALRAEVAALREDKARLEAIHRMGRRWLVSGDEHWKSTGGQPPLFVEARLQRDGTLLFAVLDDTGDVLNKVGEMEWEPQPSSRDDDFIARTRFATFEEGLDAARTAAGETP